MSCEVRPKVRSCAKNRYSNSRPGQIQCRSSMDPDGRSQIRNRFYLRVRPNHLARRRSLLAQQLLFRCPEFLALLLVHFGIRQIKIGQTLAEEAGSSQTPFLSSCFRRRGCSHFRKHVQVGGIHRSSDSTGRFDHQAQGQPYPAESARPGTKDTH